MSYAYVWEFEVKPEEEDRFLEYYGPSGVWVRLFEKADGFVETLLLRDKEQPYRYLTIDRWTSASAHEAFRVRFAPQYAAIDRVCEGLTTSEKSLGYFDAVMACPP